jgi:phosphoribosylformylglycinamidine cyclo-ligase
MEDTSIYEHLGVSAANLEVRNAIKRIDKGLYPKSVCKIVPDVLGDVAKNLFAKQAVNVIYSNTIGSKSILTYIYWKESKILSIWKDFAKDLIIDNLNEVICTGVRDNFLVSLNIIRNKFFIPDEVVQVIIDGAEEYIEFLRKQKIKIDFGGANMCDVGDVVRTITVTATVASRARQNELITNDRIQDGDIIIGLSSCGQSSLENEYNSGIGSNGLTIVRHNVISKIYSEKYTEIFDDLNYTSNSFTGTKLLSDNSGIKERSIGRIFLSPSRCYLPVIKSILENFLPSIHGLVDCSEAGQTKCLNYIENLHIIKDNMFEMPDVFKLTENEAKISKQEMYGIFNMGHGFEIFTKEKIADEIIKLAEYFGIDAKIIGHCEASLNTALTIKTSDGVFRY